MSLKYFTLAVGPWTGSPTQEVTFFDSWTLDQNLDDGCSLTFSIPGDVLEATVISELDTDVWMYLDGVLEERLRIIQIDQEWDSSGQDTIRVQAVCYRRLLGSRYLNTDLSFNQISQGQIVWDLISHTQSQTSGNLGITLLSTGPSVLRDRIYEAGLNILDIITDLSTITNGPLVEINANRQLTVTQASLKPFNSTPIVLGATAETLQRPSGARHFGNVAIVTGNQQQTSLSIATSSGLGTDPRGRWEKRSSYPTASLQTTLADYANGLLSTYQAPTTIWAVSVVPDRYFADADYDLGEFVDLVQPSTTVAPISTPAVIVRGQIVAKSISQTNTGETDIALRVLEVPMP